MLGGGGLAAFVTGKDVAGGSGDDVIPGMEGYGEGDGSVFGAMCTHAEVSGVDDFFGGFIGAFDADCEKG